MLLYAEYPPAFLNQLFNRQDTDLGYCNKEDWGFLLFYIWFKIQTLIIL